MSNKYDLIVIGAGSGGLVCAAGAAGLGAKVALIEKHKMGGDCLNTGCVPSKALIRSAKMLHYFKTAKKYGIKEVSYDFEFSDIMDRVKSVIAKIEPHDSPERFAGLGVDVKFGKYHFKNTNELTNGSETLYGKKIVIATGSRPFVPPIEGCKLEKCLTSDSIWDLRTLPKRLVVVGAGPIGSELAQCFARFGSHVIMLDNGPYILHREDEDLRKIVEASFKEDGVETRHKVNVTKVHHGETNHIVTYENDSAKIENIECDAILLAVGRKPNLEGLNLGGIGIETNPQGVVINDYCQTSVKNIYACGDVAGHYQFTHFADYQARLVLRNALFPGRMKADYRVVPWCTYTDPELARVGLSETDAKNRNIAHDVFRYDLKDLDRAICDSADTGLVKVITKKGSDKILGASIASFHAGDLLQEYVFAMKQGLGLKAIANTIHPYPTMAEATKRTADSWARTQLKPWVAKTFSWYFKTLFR
jgi:pyruvate/2-oxoglutarate dehydrogenase complex dihydrolipoamide dehydrogenase (E3) component